MSLSIGIALAITVALNAHGAAIESLRAPAMPESESVEEYVTKYFEDIPVMAAIAQCESQFRQFDDAGKVLKNKHSSAIGVMQIMSSIHAGNALKLGLDINTIEGNLGYARHLYEEQGLKPWSASKKCWSKHADHLALSH